MSATAIVILVLIALVLLAAVVALAALAPDKPQDLPAAAPSLADESAVVLGQAPARERTGRFTRRPEGAEQPAPFADEIDPVTRSGRATGR